jgi:predicted N-formylglutamate amidohydrolase
MAQDASAPLTSRDLARAVPCGAEHGRAAPLDAARTQARWRPRRKTDLHDDRDRQVSIRAIWRSVRSLEKPAPSLATEHSPLLRDVDPPPFSVVRRGACSDVLLLGDHAGNAIPASLGDLGLRAVDRTRHIAWDVGVRALGERISAILEATFIHQPFSRLVIDCNRDSQSPDSILPMSDGTPVPGNAGLGAEACDLRRLAIHAPYHECIATELALRRRAGVAPLVVALHSFTPTLAGERRPWHVGVLHDRGDTRPSRALLTFLSHERDLVVGDNQPYRMDGTDYTVPHHTYANGLPYLELEFRCDLLADPEDADRWSTRCAAWIQEVMARI